MLCISFNAKSICYMINFFGCAITAHLGYHPVSDAVVVALREAMTKEGRCSVVIGNGPLIIGVTLAMEF